MKILLDGVSVFIDNWQLIIGILVFIAVISFPFFIRLKTYSKPASVSTGIFLAFFISLTLLLRLAYVSKALLPSYFDLATHYALIKDILSQDLLQVFGSLRTNYYHMGFHFITAFFASVFQVGISKVMLILGQVILTVMPLPLFFIVKQKTRSNWAGIFAAILSAFGWYMPAHAVDWGKYPALLSLYMIMLVLCLVYLFVQNKDKLQTGKRIFFLVMFGFGVLFTAFVHSRAVIVLGMIAIAWTISMWWMRLPQLIKHSVFVLLVILLGLEVVFIRRNDVLNLLFDPYFNKGILVTTLVVILSAFAYRAYSQLTFVNLAAIGLLLISLFIPMRGLFLGRDYLTLMDRPYVEMIFFIPLSLLGGLGLAGLEKWMKSSYQRYVVLIGIGLILIHTFANYEFYPSNCCVIVGNNDLAAMAWMENQLPVDTRIGIASTALKVVAEDVVEGDVGTDAGVWVTPLTDRVTILLPNDLDFDQGPVLDMICQKKVQYIFIGEMGQPFDIARLNSRPIWYRPLLSMSRTRVYQVIGCDR